jgi:conjugal transfer/entry exclusion protein
MHQVLLYSSLFVAVLSFFLGLYALGRVAKVTNATHDLDWSSIANLTGEVSTIKKTIQTLNNRINGMHSPKLQEQELLAQLLQNQQNAKPNGKMVGG